MDFTTDIPCIQLRQCWAEGPVLDCRRDRGILAVGDSFICNDGPRMRLWMIVRFFDIGREVHVAAIPQLLPGEYLIAPGIVIDQKSLDCRLRKPENELFLFDVGRRTTLPYTYEHFWAGDSRGQVRMGQVDWQTLDLIDAEIYGRAARVPELQIGR